MMLRFPRPTDDYDAWFGPRYAQLLQWARQIVGDDPAQAEDLVHDVIVQFMVNRPDTAALRNIDRYLYTSLRNLHLSNVRRAARRQETPVSFAAFDLLDYDSLPRGVRVLQERQAARLRDEFQQQLRDIWRYAQVRKTSSKAASVLILRFFHGYYPNEIAQVLRVSRDTVDQLLRLARKEARLFVADPDPPGYADPAPLADVWPVDAWADVPDLPATLCDAALRSDPHGVCLTSARVVALYGATASSSVPTAVVAHIVSCASCLDRVNRFLGLPVLADRHPLDSLGNDRGSTPPTAGGAGGGGSRSGLRRRLDAARQRVTEVLSHKPQELRIAVNGIILGGQQVTSAMSRQTLRVTDQPFDFLEVFSEEDVRLLSINIEAPPRGPASVVQAVELTEDRRLEVRVDFSGANPLVQVLYVEPALAETREAVRRRAPQAMHAAQPSRVSPIRRLGAWLAGCILIAPSRWRLTRGGAFTTLVAATTIAALLVNYLGRPVLSAAELLQKSSEADVAWRANGALALHRSVHLDVRSGATGRSLRRRVETWQNSATGVTVRRAYDDRNQLLAGEWIDTNGTRVVYRDGAAAGDEPRLLDREAWRVALSADDFARLVGNLEHVVAAEEGGRFHLSIDRTRTPAARVLSASLILRDDWHAIEQQVTVREPAGTTEYTWIEQGWNTRPLAAVPTSVFEVDATLAGVTPSPAAAPVVIAPATASEEIAALTALRRIDADLGEEVRVRRVNGRLDVTA